MDPALLAAVVFVATFVAIAHDEIHRTFAALAGAAAMLLLGVLPQERALAAVDWNVIFVLASLMIVAGVTGRSGVFQWLAMKLTIVARGEPLPLMALLSLLTAVASPLLDSVTVMVLLAPITISLAEGLRISPAPLLIAQAMASNIGGTALLIGNPPNIMIGSAAGLDFVAFATNLGPVALLCLAAFIPTAWLLFRPSLHRAAFAEVDVSLAVVDRRLLSRSLAALTLIVLGFLVHSALGYQPATIALVGALVLGVISGLKTEDLFGLVDWSTLAFFIGLFVVVEGVVAVGLVNQVADALLTFTQGQPALTAIGLIWLSGIASGVVDNIPYTAAMIHVVERLGAQMAVEPLWWALALGACLGGNYTLVGATPNLIAVVASEKAGYPISFGTYLKYGLVFATESLVVATIYVWLRYLA